MSVAFLITTYNRQESCQRLVDSLQCMGDIVVLSDGCSYDITGCRHIKSPVHRGKQGYMDTVVQLWNGRPMADYYFMLPDDFGVEPEIVQKSLRLWHGIKDSRKICLNLYADRIGLKCWTNFLPVDKGNVWQTQWMDMCFMAENEFFRFVLTSYVKHRPTKMSMGHSSGTGAYISRLLNRSSYHLYQVKESLVYPTEEHSKSQMHNDNSTHSINTYQGKHPKSHSRIFGKPGG